MEKSIRLFWALCQTLCQILCPARCQDLCQALGHVLCQARCGKDFGLFIKRCGEDFISFPCSASSSLYLYRAFICSAFYVQAHKLTPIHFLAPQQTPQKPLRGVSFPFPEFPPPYAPDRHMGAFYSSSPSAPPELDSYRY